MTSLFRAWSRIRPLLEKNHLLICLDYDGTLSPIAPIPQQATLPKKTRHLLRALAETPSVRLAIISGRALADVKAMVGIPAIVYSGNHGFEVEGPGIRFRPRIPSSYRRLLARLEKELKKQLEGMKGVIVENKRPVLAVHYRMSPSKNIPKIQKIFRKITGHSALKKYIRTIKGKMVLEVQPPLDWNKGKIILWLLAKHKSAAWDKNTLPVYVGDDITDEDAFGALKNKGITVFVGRPRTSSAQYCLSGTDEVQTFLKRIVSLKSSKKP